MIVFITVWSLWFLSEILLNRLLHSGKDDLKGRDKGSISIIWITIAAVITLGVLISIYLPVSIGRTVIIPYAGLVLIICGMIIRFVAVLSLGRFFTVDVTIRKNHKIKTDGIYRLIRHPSYTGSILSFIGFGISLNNWFSLAVIAIPVTLAMLHRIRIEERLLLENFGNDYLEYIKKTKGINIFFIILNKKMFGSLKKKNRYNGHEELPFVDMEGNKLQEGDYVKCYRYELGICRIFLTGEGYVYESLENGTQVNWARMIDARTKYQKVRRLDQKPS